MIEMNKPKLKKLLAEKQAEFRRLHSLNLGAIRGAIPTDALQMEIASIKTELESGSEIKTWRESLGLTRMELSLKLGISYFTITKWELGKTNPSRMAQEKIDRLRVIR
jgi:DNA-binding transcriptional regulator YiaG